MQGPQRIWPVGEEGKGAGALGFGPGGLGDYRTQEQNWAVKGGGIYGGGAGGGTGGVVHPGFGPEVVGELSSEGPAPWYLNFLLSDCPRQKLGRTRCCGKALLQGIPSWALALSYGTEGHCEGHCEGECGGQRPGGQCHRETQPGISEHGFWPRICGKNPALPLC